jgi:GNAT superfamily N-acetyltransferase
MHHARRGDPALHRAKPIDRSTSSKLHIQRRERLAKRDQRATTAYDVVWLRCSVGRVLVSKENVDPTARCSCSPSQRGRRGTYRRALGWADAALAKKCGALQLAITQDGLVPMGEVQVFPGGTEETVELAYAVGADFQGRGLATRAVIGMVQLASESGAAAARLVIATDNVRSQRVARAAGFRTTDLPLAERRRKGLVLTMATWERRLN